MHTLLDQLDEENDSEQCEDVFYSAVKVPDTAKTPVRPLPGKLETICSFSNMMCNKVTPNTGIKYVDTKLHSFWTCDFVEAGPIESLPLVS